MKNKLKDLNNHLFEALERLNDEDLDDDQLDKEIKRARSISSIATKIVDNASLILEAQKIKLEYEREPFTPVALLGQTDKN